MLIARRPALARQERSRKTNEVTRNIFVCFSPQRTAVIFTTWHLDVSPNSLGKTFWWTNWWTKSGLLLATKPRIDWERFEHSVFERSVARQGACTLMAEERTNYTAQCLVKPIRCRVSCRWTFRRLSAHFCLVRSRNHHQHGKTNIILILWKFDDILVVVAAFCVTGITSDKCQDLDENWKAKQSIKFTFVTFLIHKNGAKDKRNRYRDYSRFFEG